MLLYRVIEKSWNNVKFDYAVESVESATRRYDERK